MVEILSFICTRSMCLENYCPPHPTHMHKLLWSFHICFRPLLDIGIKIIGNNNSKPRRKGFTLIWVLQDHKGYIVKLKSSMMLFTCYLRFVN